MDPDFQRVRLRAPSPSPPPRIRLRATSDHDNSTVNAITTPRRRSRQPPTRRDHATRQIRSQINLRRHTTHPSTPSDSLPYPRDDGSTISSPIQAYDLGSEFPHFDAPHLSSPTSTDRSGENTSLSYSGPIPDLSANEMDDAYDHFVEAVLAQVCSIYQLTQRLFMVNGWNPQMKTTTSTWYHLVKMVVAHKVDFVCMCPAGRSSGNCFHTRFLQQYGEEQFQDLPDDSSDDNQTFLVSRIEEMTNGIFSNIFSVPKSHNPTIRNRAVVQFVGSDDGHGTWSCAKHPKDSDCNDIQRARQSLRSLIDMNDGPIQSTVPENPSTQGPIIKRAATKISDSISYLPRSVPAWARISSDPPSPSIPSMISPPDKIPLDANPYCRFCKSHVLDLNPFVTPSREVRSCLIYGLVTVMQSQIERQRCPSCNRWLGPDCRDIGLFNWNNLILMTHQLLDDYTSSFTTSETPFTAWVAVVSRRYPSGTPFVLERTFRDVWFSYVRLVAFEGSSRCPTCGPTPSAIIFDGVSLSFNRRNILPTLRPPTTIHQDSIIRDKVTRRTNLQLVPDRSLRKDIRSILTGPSLISPQTGAPMDVSDSLPISSLSIEDISEESGSSMDEGRRQRNNAKRQAARLKEKQALLTRVNLIPQVLTRLTELSPSLAALFHRIFGVPAINAGLEAPSVYRKFFIQVTAEETALQMMNNQALQSLLAFIQSPGQRTASGLILIPSLYNLLQYELSTHHQIHLDTLQVASWLYYRGETVRKTLLVHHTEPPKPALQDESSWQMTGCYYEMPQIRHRPIYPALKEDSPEKKDAERQAKGACRKFFSTYSPKRLTGGIMVAWCSHSISYGFHCIPVGEGRNDVFSALYTRWEKAPPVVVYDFSCALQPYCSLREPEFFQDTLFVIDDFHASDHTKCCPSSFLATYCDSDPRLLLLNSSAAECGNGGLGRIRKSISYMGQDRAIMYCMVFLSIWNRQRIRKMEGRTSH